MICCNLHSRHGAFYALKVYRKLFLQISFRRPYHNFNMPSKYIIPTKQSHGPGPMGMPMQPQKSMFEKREEAKSRAFEEAMAAAKAAAAKTGDLSSHLVTGRGGGGKDF